MHVGGHHFDTAGRMERLISALKSVLDKKHDLQTVVSTLENLVPTPQERKKLQKVSTDMGCMLASGCQPELLSHNTLLLLLFRFP